MKKNHISKFIRSFSKKSNKFLIVIISHVISQFINKQVYTMLENNFMINICITKQYTCLCSFTKSVELFQIARKFGHHRL